MNDNAARYLETRIVCQGCDMSLRACVKRYIAVNRFGLMHNYALSCFTVSMAACEGCCTGKERTEEFVRLGGDPGELLKSSDLVFTFSTGAKSAGEGALKNA